MAQDPETLKKAADRAIAAVGLPSDMAKALGITRQAVIQWIQVPVKHIEKVEELTGYSRYELRPDVYGTSPPKLPRQKREAAA